MELSRTSNRTHLAFLSLAAVFAVLFAIVLSPSHALAVQNISAENVDSFDGCTDGNDAQEWHFIINQIDGEANAPLSIHVEWADGGSEEVPRSSFSGNSTAHYTTFSHLDSTVTSATAVIYDGWNGQFVISHGPCAVPTSTPTEVPATETPTEVSVTEVPTETPPVDVTETVGGEEETPIPTDTPAAGVTETISVTETVAGEEETPVATVPVEELPATGVAPDGKGTTGMLGALVLAMVLAGVGWLVRLQSKHAKR
jgi:hypothetical protein